MKSITKLNQRGHSMKIWLFLIAMLAVQATALAAPFVSSDPVDDWATHCGWQLNEQPRVDVPVGADKVCKLDLGGLSAGSYTVSTTAVVITPFFSRMESLPSPNFTFSVPGIPSAPTGLHLTL